MPDHSAFSHARNERFRDSDIFRGVFERVASWRRLRPAIVTTLFPRILFEWKERL